MQPNVIDSPPWNYELTNAVPNKEANRTAMPPMQTWEIKGHDPSFNGGIRPHYGFKHFRDLTGNLGSSYADQELAGFFWVTFRISSTKYGMGVVYRVRDGSGGADCKYFIEWRTSDSATWYGPTSLVSSGSRLTAGAKQMHVEVYGQFVYVFVEGQEPFMFYRNDSLSAGTLTVATDTGPNNPGTYVLRNYVVAGSPEYQHSSIGATENLPGGSADTNFLAVGSFAAPATGYDSAARLINWNFSPTAYAFAYKMDLSGYGTPITGPSTSGMFTGTPPQDDPYMVASSSVVRVSDNLKASGAASDTVPWCFPNGRYLFAYRLYDSRTGRWSSFSKTLDTSAFDSNFDPQKVADYTTVSGAGKGFIAIDIQYDSDRFDTIYLYRSLRDQTTLRSEGSYTLSTYHVKNSEQPTSPLRRAMIWWRRPDSVLQFTDISDVANLYDPEMPTGGSAIYFEGCLFVGKTGVLDTGLGGLGVIRWSDPTLQGVEVFSPLDKYVLTDAGEEVERFMSLGKMLVGFTKNQQYTIYKYGTQVKIEPVSSGFGIVGSRAACQIGSTVYFAGHRGIQSLQQDGTLSDVSNLNNVFQEWAPYGLSTIQMAYDPLVKVVVVHNPAVPRGHTVLIYIKEGAFTEVVDANFTHVTEGNIPENPSAATAVTSRRTAFVYEVNTTGAYGGFIWRVVVMDYLREKTDGSGNDRQSTLDFTGTGRFTLLNGITGIPADYSIDLGATIGSRVEGCMLYQMSGPGAGKYARILRKSGTSVVLDSTDITDFLTGSLSGGGVGLDEGVRLAISPMYVRWTGTIPGMLAEDGSVFSGRDFFRVRGVRGLKCVFTGVGGEASDDGTEDARFVGLVFRGNESEPEARGFPYETNGEKYESVIEGPVPLEAFVGASADANLEGADGVQTHSPRASVDGAAVYPAVEVVCTDLDFQLLAVSVDGTIKGTLRESLPRTN